MKAASYLPHAQRSAAVLFIFVFFSTLVRGCLALLCNFEFLVGAGYPRRRLPLRHVDESGAQPLWLADVATGPSRRLPLYRRVWPAGFSISTDRSTTFFYLANIGRRPQYSSICSRPAPRVCLLDPVHLVDTGLKDAMDVSADANGFLRTFPLQSLLSTQSPRDVALALPAIFSHFQQKLKLSPVSLFLLDIGTDIVRWPVLRRSCLGSFLSTGMSCVLHG